MSACYGFWSRALVIALELVGFPLRAVRVIPNGLALRVCSQLQITYECACARCFVVVSGTDFGGTVASDEEVVSGPFESFDSSKSLRELASEVAVMRSAMVRILPTLAEMRVYTCTRFCALAGRV